MSLAEDEWSLDEWSLDGQNLDSRDIYKKGTARRQRRALSRKRGVDIMSSQALFYQNTSNQISSIWWNSRFAAPKLKGLPDAAGTPACLSIPKQQHVFYLDINSSLQHIWWSTADHTVHHEEWPQDNMIIGDPAVMYQHGELHVFSRDHDNLIEHSWKKLSDNTSGCRIWGAEPHGPPGAAGNPSIFATPGQLHAFYRTDDGSIHHLYSDQSEDTIRSQDWTAMSGGAPKAAGDPFAFLTPGQQHVVYRTVDGNIQEIFWEQASNSIKTQDCFADVDGAPMAAGDPCIMLTPGQHHLFYRTVDGNIQQILWDQATDSTEAQDWTAMAGGAPKAAGDPSAMTTPGQLHVYYRTVDGNVQELLWRQAAANTVRTVDWTEKADAPLSASNVACSVTEIFPLMQGGE